MPQSALRDAVPALDGLKGIDEAISHAQTGLLKTQRADGHFVFELEADVSIPSEYVLFHAFRGSDLPVGLATKFATYLRAQQTACGGWPLFTEGGFNISSSVKAYFALKMLGDDANAPHMRCAREAIHRHGGAAESNVFTRALLALFGEVPWSAIPVMPVEIMHLPRWFPFHLDKISYWARTVLGPMMVVNSVKPRAKNPRDIHIPELFVLAGRRGEELADGRRGQLAVLVDGSSRGVDRAAAASCEPHFPKGPAPAQRSTRAVAFATANG